MTRSGHLSNLRRQGKGPRPRSNGSNRGPLRKIVGYDGWIEVLECGHHQNPRRDLMGETSVVRRRCVKCKQVKP